MTTLTYMPESLPIRFGVDKLCQALWESGQGVQILPNTTSADIVISGTQEALEGLSFSLESGLPAEGYRIRRVAQANHEGGASLHILAKDESGAMYGILALAEHIRHHGSLESMAEGDVYPRFAFRAIKFNLPWSTYRQNQCFEIQRETVRDLSFWREFLDMMAENRYNVLTLWSIHPFPYMIRPQHFPEATPFSDAELAEWKEYWSALFRMAKERGIETYIVTWNIFVSGAFKQHYDAKAIADYEYYNGDSYSTDQIKHYNRECVSQMIEEYPDLTGVGVSLGERMNDMTPQERQEWINDVYFDALKGASRPAKFIHRAPFSVDPAITRNAIESSEGLIEPVWVEVKFNWSHAYSSPRLLLTHGGSRGMDGYWNPKPMNYKITWMIRNEDFFTWRWAQTQFIRDHIAQNGQSYVGGYFVGSECFIPAADYSHIRESQHVNWNYTFQKHWLFYMIWGRLLYDPFTPDSVFIDAINLRYSHGVGQALFAAYASVCQMPMRLASIYSFTWDFTLYSEGFLATGLSEYDEGRCFISLEDLLDAKTFDPMYVSISDYVDGTRRGESFTGRVTPLQLADVLEQDARRGLDLVKELSDRHPTLDCEVADIQAWAHLGLYFAAKLRAGVSLCQFGRSQDETDRATALSWLSAPNALTHWDNLVEVTESHYHEQPLMHLGHTPFSWALLRPQVVEDIRYAEGYGHGH